MATAQQQADKAIVPTAPAGKHSQDREATVNPSGTSGDDGGGVAVRLDQARGKAVLFATVTGSTVGLITATIVNVALPAIGSAFHVGVAGRQWVVTGYLLTLSALILLGGALGDRFGRRRVYVIGLVWYTVASVLCALAPSLSLLVAARVMQGVGGALLTPSSLAIIQATFIPADRARAIGAWSALLSIGALTGPPLGGFLVDMLDGSSSW